VVVQLSTQQQAMSAFTFQIAPVVLLAWLVFTPCLVVAIWQSFGSHRSVIYLLLCNAIVLAVFCGIWYLGFYMSEYWMHIIDLGAPWSWFGLLVGASYMFSLLPLRKHSKAVAKSFVGPVITAPAFWLWIQFCAFKFDPFF
jgi:hypothetical protein